MALRLFLPVIFCIGFCNAWVDERPVLETRDGNLIIASAKDKNITLITTGKSTVKINDIDLIEVTRHAQKATSVVEKWEAGYLRDLEANVDRLVNAVEGPDGLQYKLKSINGGDDTLANSSSGESAKHREAQMRNRDTLFKSAILNIGDRVDNLEKTFRTIATKLREDECAKNPCMNGGTCIKIYDGFRCICPSNWEGTRCTDDVNECQTLSGTTLGCQNGATCTNLPGSYRCSCSTGWHGIRCNTKSTTCNYQNSRKLCGNGDCVSTTENELGFTCDCDPGWKSEGTNLACTKDIDECAEGEHRCSSEPLVPCINLPGGYKCGSCPPGYTGSGLHCVDVDECLVENGGCSMEPMVECKNTIGSRKCGGCPPGYFGDGINCTYVGACKIDNGGCHPLATCVESPIFTDVFSQCNCPEGYTGNGIGPQGCELGETEDVPCSKNPCHNGVCVRTGFGYFCTCFRGFTGTHCEISKNPCDPNPCKNDGVCTAKDREDFTCECTEQFTGSRCQYARQSCGGLFTNPSGILRYPLPDDNPTDFFECLYTIVADTSKVLKITFLQFDVEPSEKCEKTYLQIKDGRSNEPSELKKYCNSSLPLLRPFKTTHNAVNIVLRRNNRMDRLKFSLRWEFVTPECGGLLTGDHGKISSPGSPGMYPHNKDCFWEIRVKPGKRIQFHFYSLAMEQHPTCDHDYLEINETTSNRDIRLGRFCNQTVLAPLLTSGSFAKVHFHSDDKGTDTGFEMSYLAVEGIPGCGGVFTADEGIISSPGFPSKYPRHTVCEWKIQLQEGLRVRLNWMSIDLEPSWGSGCKYDSVKVFSGGDTDSPIVGTHCGNDLPASVTISSNVVLIVFTTQNPFGVRQGFQLKYETICGTEFRNPSGVIKSLHYPEGYTEKKTCIYEIIQPPNTAIALRIVDMDIHGDYPCNGDRLEIYDGDSDKSQSLGKICGGRDKIPSQPYLTKQNFMYLKFTTLGGSTGNRGFLANYTTLINDCGGIFTEPSGVIASSVTDGPERCVWVIKAPERHTVQITFDLFDVNSSSDNCTDRYIAIYDGLVDSGQEIGRFCGSHPKALTSQGSIMSIVHNSDEMGYDEFELHYVFIDTSRSCGGHFYGSTGVIMTPNYPKPYPMHTSCEWFITVPNKRQIILNVKDFLIDILTDCRTDYLEIRAGGTEASIFMGKFCGTSIPKVLKGFTNQMYLKFVSHSNDKRGFNIEWESSTLGCGGTLTGSNGEIFSPNYPRPYHHQATCTWKIRTNAGNRLRIVFVDVDILGDEKCSSDYIEIFSGSDDRQINGTRYCNKPSSSIDMDSNLATIRFRSDLENAGRGFHIKYESTCVQEVRGFKGVIESPNFPDRYPGYANCTWIITAPYGNKINVTFSHFSLPRMGSGHPSCPGTFVEVKEGTSGTPSTKLGKFCDWDIIPQRISSTQDQVFVHFEALPYDPYEGFRLEWIVNGCGGHLTKPSGEISSPGYPRGHPKIQCEWLIEVEKGHSIEINFSDLDLERVPGCSENVVLLYGGGDVNAPLLATLCNSKSPVTYTSTTNKMFVRFAGHTEFSGRGFKASYKSVQLTCGGTFRTASGMIHSANYPLNYPNNQNCEWLIQVDKHHVVNITFNDFDIEDKTNCTDNHVKLIDGTSRDGPVLGTFCKSELPPSIVSSGNSMLVVMRSNSRVTSKGFQAVFSKACGARIVTNGTGLLEAGLDPHVHGMSHCIWHIVADDPANHVTLSFSHLAITGKGLDNCDENYVHVYENDKSDSVIQRWCTNTIPRSFTSAGNALTIELHGDVLTRFIATYSVLDSACGGEHFSASGWISSPESPNDSPHNAECIWLLKTSPGNVITLNFVWFRLLVTGNCNSRYLEIREDSAIGKLIGVYCTETGQTMPIIESSKNLWIKFRSDDSGIGEGFSAKYDLKREVELKGTKGEISSPLYPNLWREEHIISWRIVVEPGMAVRLEFDDVHIDRHDHCMDNLVIYDGFNAEAPEMTSVCGLVPPGPVVSTSNVIFIRFGGQFDDKAENWFHLNWYQVPSDDLKKENTFTQYSDCQFEYDLTSSDNNSVTFTSPGWPTTYRHNLDCTWVIKTLPGYHLLMKFLALDLEVSLNCMAADYVAVYNGNGLATTLDRSQMIKTACGHDDVDEAIVSGPIMTVKFHTDFFINAAGFQAKVSRECGGELNGPNGVIDSDHVLSSYDEDTPNVTCEWYINVQRGRTIEVAFDKFSVGVDDKAGCHDNYLLLKNGAGSDSPLLGTGKFCSQSKPPAKLQTTGNKLYVKAVGFKRQMDFKIVYRQVSTSCGDSVRLGETNTRATFNSPNYPNIPPPFSECVWSFIAPAGERLSLHFHDRFDLTTSPNCSTEYVEVRDGGTEDSVSLGIYCGNEPPSSITTTGNMMYVHFYTDTADPKNGFNATVTSGEVCGLFLRASTGVVMSPNYPHSYPVDQDCSWTIVGPPDHTLTMKFQDFNLPSSKNCENTDYVNITERLPFKTDVTNAFRLCGTENPGIVETSTNTAVVSFHSDKKIDDGYRGFSLNFTASKEPCGGEISGTSGDFETTGYPNPSASSRFCQWLLTVPEGSSVVLEISNLLDVVEKTDLKFYNDKLAKSEITRFETYRVFSTSNYMLVVYQSRAGQPGFKASFAASPLALPCGGPINNEMGSLLLPTSPTNETSFFCQWKLKVPASIEEFSNYHSPVPDWGIIVLDLREGVERFRATLTVTVSGSLGQYGAYSQSRLCEDRSKYISVSDGQRKIGQICGNLKEEKKIFRSPSHMNIIDLMNGTLEGQVNVKIDYYWKACGGILTGPKHVVKTPKRIAFPRSCVWHAKFEDPGDVIGLSISEMNLGNCSNGGILVRNGGPLSPVIDTYCGNNKPGLITSSSNELWIEYWAHEPPGDFVFDVSLVSGSCGGAIRGSSKEITSPGFPKQYPNNAECTWEITADPGYTVGLTFVDRFDIESSYQCSHDFVQIFNWVYDATGKGGWDDGIKYCGRNRPFFNSTSNRVKVLFRSNDNVRGDGFRAKWEENCGGIFEATGGFQSIQSPHFPDSYPPNLFCNYTIQAPQNKEIMVKFTDFDLEDTDVYGNCAFDNITTKGYLYHAWSSHPFDTTTVNCGNEIPSSIYMRAKVNVIFQSDASVESRGFRFQYMLTECGGEITEPTQLKPPTMHSGEYFGRFNCTWVIRAPEQKSVVLRFDKLDIPSSYGCETDEVRAVEGDTVLSPILTRICGRPYELLAPVKSEGNVMTVMFRSDGTNRKGHINAKVTFSNNEASGCGGKIRLDQTMTFRTQTSEFYEPFEDCQWIVGVETGKLIRLTINQMDLKNSTNPVVNGDESCNGDYLEVRDGSASTNDLIGRYCGNVPPPIITTTTNKLWIRFLTDDSVEGSGVVATLEPIDSPCGKHFREINDETVIIESPGYPEDFPAGIQCRWVFKSYSSLSQLRIHFDDMDMEDTQNCNGDRLEVSHEITNYAESGDTLPSLYPGRVPQFTSIFRMEKVQQPPYRYCGKSAAIEHYSESNELHVLLKTTTDNLPKPRKFKFAVERASCNRNYTAEQGRIVHRDIKDCWVTITAPPNHTISLYFNYFVFYRGQCSTSYLKIHDGDFSANETTLCGMVDAVPIFSTGNKLSLHAKSGWPLAFGGPRYDLQYTTTDKGRGCGGKIYSYEGKFTSPMYPNDYNREGTCEWEITVPHGYTVSLEFMYFDISDDVSCATDYLKIVDESEGGSESTFCSERTPVNFYSKSNKVTVVYKTSVNNSGTGWKIRFTAVLANSKDEDSSEYISDMEYI